MPFPALGRNLGGTHSVRSEEMRGNPRRLTGSSCTARTSKKSYSRSLATWETICYFQTLQAPQM
jgi:hypothetical protein